MMNLEDIINQLNTYIRNIRVSRKIDNNGILILQKQCIPHTTIKAYKDYIITLWYVDNGTKQIINSVSYKDKIMDSNIAEKTKEFSIKFLDVLFILLSDGTLNKIIDGSIIDYSPQ